MGPVDRHRGLGLPDEFLVAARQSLLPLAAAGLVQQLDEDVEVLPGVRVLHAPGHTPGHAIVRIDSRGETAFYLGDAIAHPLNAEHPAWLCAFDLDPGQTIATRQRLLEEAVRSDASVMAFHLPDRVRVVRHGNGYRCVCATAG
jgi:glyoxylase-like metal-dependent hydrolase (beta-lactamase superfamily II)